MRPSPQVMLELSDAAKRLGLRQKELEAMIATGQVEALRGEFLCIIPLREVERLIRSLSVPK
ncbi:MAG TPA: hypothetical protein VIO37_05085 [Candidatus Dormibacteraeota bacterium]